MLEGTKEKGRIMNYKTKGNLNLSNQPKVYFCCNEKEHDLYFEAVSDEILEIVDCAIFYDDKSDEESEWQELLKTMNLFVVIVTNKFLSEKNQAKSDFLFALENGIPVLPLLKEANLIDQFNQIASGVQALSANGKVDKTEIAYKEKLIAYLKSILMNDKLINRIHNASDGHVFLSYRKKDRKHLLELISEIREDDDFIDVPIWYDEFLVFGEEFSNQIEEKLQKGSAFVLTVTPNLINEDNYVKREEYPKAVEYQREIIPVEMIETDKSVLESQYPNIPNCIHKLDKERIHGSLKSVLDFNKENSAEHDFLVGMGFLTGTDREKNVVLALKKIVAAANEGYEEAIHKLVNMYECGDGVKINFTEAIKWQQKLLEVLEEKATNNYQDTSELIWQKIRLGNLYSNNDQLQEAKDKYHEAIEYAKKDEKEFAYFKTMAQDRVNDVEGKQAFVFQSKEIENQKVALDKKYKSYKRKNFEDTFAFCVEIADEYMEIAAYKEARNAYKEAYRYFQIQNRNLNKQYYLGNMIGLLQKMGDLSAWLGDYTEAEKYLKDAIGCSEKKLKINPGKESLSSMWISYEKLSDFYRETFWNEEGFRKALEYLVKSIEYGEQVVVGASVKEKCELANGYRRKGGLHEFLQEYDEAIEAYEKAKALFESEELDLSEELNFAMLLDDMGEVYIKKLNQEPKDEYFDNANMYFTEAYNKRDVLSKKEALTENEKEMICEGLSFSYDNLGRMAFRDIKDERGLEMAKTFLEKNIKLCEELYTINKNDITRMYHLFKAYSRVTEMHANSSLGSKEDAQKYFEKTMRFAQETGLEKQAEIATDIERIKALFKR